MYDHLPSLFDQTVRDTDEEFYATFPEAREAALAAIFSANDDLNLASFYSQEFSPVDDSVFSHSLPPQYQQQYTQSSFDPVFAPAAGRADQICSRDTSIAPTPDGCQLSVMCLDDYPEPRTQTSYFHTKQRRAHSVSHIPSRALTWDSAPSPSRPLIRLSPLSSKRQFEKKPPLACLFCRGRKIACGPPLPGSLNITCNQCQRRSLPCKYPSESRRGMRKKKPSDVTEAAAADV